MIQPCRYVQKESKDREYEGALSKDTVSYNIGYYMGDYRKHFNRYMLRGMIIKDLYSACVHGIQYEDLSDACEMPDTFQSWFTITILHVWMAMVRLKSEGKHGDKLINCIVDLMWKDVEERMKLLGGVTSSERKESIRAFAEQFNGCVLAFDEGLLGDDRVLAAALWRNLFRCGKHANLESIGLLVEYVRKQIRCLERQDSDHILMTGKIKWLPFINDGENKMAAI